MAFAVDFAVRLWLADQRLDYARRHWYDVALIALPMLRPLRLLRLIALLRVMNRTATGSLAGRATTYVVGTAVLAICLGALATLDVERDASDANITSLGDALWWAVMTVTTMGYVGIAMLGVITASLAAWFTGQVRTEPDLSERQQS